MNEDYDTIRKIRIDMAAQIMQAVVIHDLEYPRGTSIINEHQQLVMYVDTDAGLQGWRDYVGVDRYGSLLPWPWDHDWYVLVVSLQAEDSGAGGIEPSSPPPVSVTDDIASAARVAGLQTAADFQRVERDAALASPLIHRFDEIPNVSVLVCTCGKWPGHHVHTGDRAACTCDECSELRRGSALASALLDPDAELTVPCQQLGLPIGEVSGA